MSSQCLLLVVRVPICFPLCAVGDAEAVLGFADGRFEVLTTKHCTSDREYVQSVKRMKTPFKCPCSFVDLPL